eukprot:CAMPEP_0196809920 /NCGR_PEP_ID=MMETSP1362-20130617/9796_1 /TAXON_ID=163516 /ORGANISM="Leptocylindrus danicus, Strain CCMP1856" /LENGTH=592 /DNA_ID=CAMNT_0042184761 /DNA_START=38 /DNA_END=1816 /DNA_ORIENTATION=+
MMNWIKNTLSPSKRRNSKTKAGESSEKSTEKPPKITENSKNTKNSSPHEQATAPSHTNVVHVHATDTTEPPLHLHACRIPNPKLDSKRSSRSSSPAPAIIRERSVSSESLDTTAYATSSSVSLASQSNPGSNHQSRRNSGDLHVHAVLPPTEDMLTDKAAFEDCVFAPSSNTSASSNNSGSENAAAGGLTKHVPTFSLSTVCERMSEDDLEDNKAFSDVIKTSTHTIEAQTLQQLETLGECDEEESEEADDAVEDNSSEQLLEDDLRKNYHSAFQTKHRTSYRTSLGPMEIMDDDPMVESSTNTDTSTTVVLNETHLLNKRQLNEESLKDLIEALSTPEAWKQLQAEKHALSHSSRSSNSSNSGAKMMSNSRPRSRNSSLCCNEHDPQPPTVDMLTDGMGFQELSPRDRNPDAAPALKQKNTCHLNTVPERLIGDDLEDNRAFADVTLNTTKRQSSKSGALNTVPERLSEDDLEDNRAFADVTVNSTKRQSSTGSSLNTVPERISEDNLEDNRAFADVMQRQSSAKSLRNSGCSLNTVPERLCTEDDLEDSKAYMDVRTERLSAREFSLESMGVVEEELGEDEESSDSEDEE